MQTRGLLPLSIALLMLPQMAQTLFSPALADFARAFSVPPEAASQALTVYFVAFAFGVFVWGRACDRIGRKPAMLCGLFVYAVACCAAFSVTTFDGLLLSQAAAAFGAAVGSVVTQTVLRDRYAGAELARIFSVVGMILAVSPAIGLFAGAALVQTFGYKGVVATLFVLSSVLIVWTVAALPETRPLRRATEPLSATLKIMLHDSLIWRSALLVPKGSYYRHGRFKVKCISTPTIRASSMWWLPASWQTRRRAPRLAASGTRTLHESCLTPCLRRNLRPVRHARRLAREAI